MPSTRYREILLLIQVKSRYTKLHHFTTSPSSICPLFSPEQLSEPIMAAMGEVITIDNFAKMAPFNADKSTRNHLHALVDMGRYE